MGLGLAGDLGGWGCISGQTASPTPPDSPAFFLSSSLLSQKLLPVLISLAFTNARSSVEVSQSGERSKWIRAPSRPVVEVAGINSSAGGGVLGDVGRIGGFFSLQGYF